VTPDPSTSSTTRAVVYARVSDPESQSEERQVAELRRIAVDRGWLVVEEVRERASGARDNRPGLARVLDLAQSGAVDLVAVWELSRLTRGGIGALFDIVRKLDSADVNLYSAQEPWVSGEGATRELLLAVLAWAAGVERQLVVERTRSSLAQIRSGARPTKSGRPIGRPRIYDAEFAAKIRELRDTPTTEGPKRPWSQIAMILHRPAGSLRKVYSASQAATPRAINPADSLGHRGRASGPSQPGGAA